MGGKVVTSPLILWGKRTPTHTRSMDNKSQKTYIELKNTPPTDESKGRDQEKQGFRCTKVARW